MSFHEDRFPTDISYGSRGGPGYSTSIIGLDSGQEVRVARWSQPRHRYNARYGIRSLANMNAVLEFYHARQGPTHGFRWKDFMDFTTNADHRSEEAWNDQSLGVLASGATMQLRKAYTSGPTTRYRNITKPVSGTVVVGWDDGDGLSEKTETTDWTVDTTTGIITITAGALAGATGKTIYAGCEFDVPVRFGEEIDAMFPINMPSYDSGIVPDIPIVEVKDSTVHSADFNYGGSTRYTAAGAHSHAASDGRVIVCAPSGADNMDINLPSLTNNYQLGGPWFYVIHAGGTGTVTVYEDAVSVIALAQNEACVINCIIDSGGSREWRAWG